MSTKSDGFPCSFGRAEPNEPLCGLAGHTLTLSAEALLGDRAPADPVWEINGKRQSGKKLAWTPDRPGVFHIIIKSGGDVLHSVDIRVDIRLSDIAKLREKLDGYVCILASRPRGLVAAPLFEKPKAELPKQSIDLEIAKRHPAFAEMAEAHTRSYRKHFGVLPFVYRTKLPSGLYAVFPDTLLYLGSNAAVLRAAELVQQAALQPPNTALSLRDVEAALHQLDIGKMDFPSDIVQVDKGELSLGPRIANMLNSFGGAVADFAKSLGGGVGALNSLIDLDAGRRTVTTRMFGAGGGVTRSLESMLGGFLGPNGNVFTFGEKPKPLFKPGAAVSAGAEGGSPSGRNPRPDWPSTGWERATDRYGGSFVPYKGNPLTTGEPGFYRNKDSSGTTFFYGKGDAPDAGAPSPAAPDGGTPAPAPGGGKDGGSDPAPEKSEEEKLFDLDEELKKLNDDAGTKDGGTNDGGTTKPVNIDNPLLDITADQVRWAIITRGGGLTTDPSPDAEDSSGTNETIVPGGGYSDPMRPDIFYQWVPNAEENSIPPKLDPTVTDPVDEEAGLFPMGGPQPSGVPGTPREMLATTTGFHGKVMIQTFSGRDASRRPVDGVVGGVHIDIF